MSLIRSEHLNEQAVQKAKDELADAERTLEEARSELEKKERKQYHEEQIWSDTIRRNSTWVTFGLMGVNILLLLSSLAIFEPWRRRRLVREVRKALEEKHILAAPVPAIEKEVDKVVEPAGTALEVLEEQSPIQPEASLPEVTIAETRTEERTVGELPLAAGEVLPQEAAEIAPSMSLVPETETATEPQSQSATAPAPAVEDVAQKATPGSWDAYREKFEDLFSERQVVLKKVDVTTIALEGAAAGVAVMGLLFVLLRPR